MDAKVRSSLTKALRDLEAERASLDRQITAVRAVLGPADGGKPVRHPVAARKRRSMSAKARKLISTRMKAVWAKRRAEKKTAAAAK